MTSRLYEESIMQHNICCWHCGNENPYILERHEAFFGNPWRQLSIEDKLTVLLCANSCHRNGPEAVHNHRGNDLQIKRAAQQVAMDYYGWSVAKFAYRYDRNYLTELEW